MNSPVGKTLKNIVVFGKIEWLRKKRDMGLMMCPTIGSFTYGPPNLILGPAHSLQPLSFFCEFPLAGKLSGGIKFGIKILRRNKERDESFKKQCRVEMETYDAIKTEMTFLRSNPKSK